MILVITSIQLKNPWYFFQLSLHAMRITTQIKGSKCVALKKQGFYLNHYTMTLWKNKEDMLQFSRNGDHLDAMYKAGTIAKEVRTFTVEAEEFPKWSEAKLMLGRKEKLLQYD